MSFRTEHNNILKFSSLFLEPKYEDGAIYTLKDIDLTHKGKFYPSLYKLYIKMSDVTEYDFANLYFESYQHWAELCEMDFFKPYIHRWRKELELKVKSGALKEIIEQSVSEDPKKRLEAAKYLYEKVYVGDKHSKGRPSKKEIKAEAQRQAQELKIINEHWERLN